MTIIYEDLSGNVYGALTVIERITSTKRGVWFRCLCTCGNYSNVTSGNLKKGSTVSCGHSCLYCPSIKYTDLRERAIALRWKGYEHNARIRNLLWQLTLIEFTTIIQQPCLYCGGKTIYSLLLGTPTKTVKLLASGVDRIDSTLGYILENCVPCCKICNLAKQSLAAQDYINHCKKVAAFNDH